MVGAVRRSPWNGNRTRNIQKACEKVGREKPSSVCCLARRNYQHHLPIHLLSSDNVLNWSHLTEGFRGLVISKCSVTALGCQAFPFNMMIYATVWLPKYTFRSVESTKCILLVLCFSCFTLSILFWYPFLKMNTSQVCTKAILSIMSFKLCSSVA